MYLGLLTMFRASRRRRLSGNNSPLPQLSVAALSPLKALPREGTPPHKGTSPQPSLE